MCNDCSNRKIKSWVYTAVALAVIVGLAVYQELT